MRRLALCLACVLALTACESSRPAASPSRPGGDILIGSDLPLTGFYGDAPPLAEAIQLAVDQNPRIGRFKLAYWSLDDALAGAASPEKGLQNVERLIKDPHVLGVIGPFTSPVAVAEIPVANQAALVLISPATTSACLTRSQPACGSQADELRPSGRNNFFRIAPPDPLQGAAMARYLVAQLHMTQAAAINEMGDGGRRYVDSFAAQLRRLGGNLVLSEDVTAGTTDFTDFMTSAKAKGAQAVYALGSADDQVCVAASQMLAGMVFVGTDSFTKNRDCIAEAGTAAGSMFGTLPDVDATQLPRVPAVVGAYQKKFPKTALGSDYQFAAYDCAMILIDAIKSAVAANNGLIPSRQQVLDAVAQTRANEGATGTYAFDANGDAKVPLMSIYQVKNGQWTFVQRLEMVGDA